MFKTLILEDVSNITNILTLSGSLREIEPVGRVLLSFEAQARLLEPVRLVSLYSASSENPLGAGTPGNTATFLLASFTFTCIRSHFVSKVVVC